MKKRREKGRVEGESKGKREKDQGGSDGWGGKQASIYQDGRGEGVIGVGVITVKVTAVIGDVCTYTRDEYK